MFTALPACRIGRGVWEMRSMQELFEAKTARVGQQISVGGLRPRLSTPVCDIYIYPGTTPKEFSESLGNLYEILETVEEGNFDATPVLCCYREGDEEGENTSPRDNME